MSVRVLLFWLSMTIAASAQSFAGLGEGADGFALPKRGTAFEFPRDYGAHPEYRIEWWYVTANLTGTDGREYGVQWTLFRSARAPRIGGWRSPQTWMGHTALTTPEAHFAAERFARGGIGQAGAAADPFDAWIDDWSLTSQGSGYDGLRMKARTAEFAFELDLTAEGPMVFHGDNGFSVKSAEGQASYYFSQPFYAVSGAIQTPNGQMDVTGHAWLDREYSSQPLGRTQSGWDWFALTFESGHRLMTFALRDSQNAAFSSGSWISPDGTFTSISDGSITATPLRTSTVNGREVPTEWRLEYPARSVDITVSAINPQAWNDLAFSYWEGPVRATGTHIGKGYLEMTGYE